MKKYTLCLIICISALILSSCGSSEYVGKWASVKISKEGKTIEKNEYKTQTDESIDTFFQFELMKDGTGYIRLDSENTIDFEWNIDKDGITLNLEKDNVSHYEKIYGEIDGDNIILDINKDTKIYLDKVDEFKGDATFWGTSMLTLVDDSFSGKLNDSVSSSSDESESMKASIIPDITKYSEDDAIKAIEEKGFIPIVRPIYSDDNNISDNCVVKTEPEAGTEYITGNEVIIYINHRKD